MDFFSKCNMVIRTELSFYKFESEIKLPFYFHIKDIKNDFFSDSNEFEVGTFSKDIYFVNKNKQNKNKYRTWLQYVDLENFIIQEDDDIPSYILELTHSKDGVRIFKDVDCMYKFLVDTLGFTELDFENINIFIKANQNKLVNQFIDMLHEELKLGDKTTDPSESYMILRCAYELNHTSTVFPENSNLSISEYSFREIRTQRAFMSRKCEIEAIQMKQIEDSRKK